MCKIAEYPQYYSAADYQLRNLGMNRSMPGYELLKRGIVNCVVEKNIAKEQLLKNVKKGVVIPMKNLPKNGRDAAEQLMLEAIKSIGIEIPVYEFVKQIAVKLR